MSKKETTHNLDETNRKRTSLLLLFFGVSSFALGILILQAPVHPRFTVGEILGLGIAGWVFLIIGVIGILFGLLIPFFKFDKLPTFESLHKSSTYTGRKK